MLPTPEETDSTVTTQTTDQPDPQAKLAEAISGLTQRLDNIENKSTAQSDAGPNSLDELLAELGRESDEEKLKSATQAPATDAPQQAPDLEKMSSTQLANFLVVYMHSHYFQPLLEQIELFRVRDEIKDAAREAKAAGEDLFAVKKEVFQVLEKRPNLSVKEAYRLVKAAKGPSEKKQDHDDATSSTEKVTRIADFGTRPGVARTSATKAAPNTIKEAAELAWDEVMKTASK